MELDSSRFPLMVMRWTGPVSDEVLEAFIQECNGLASRAVEQRLHYLMVSVGDGDLSAKQRKRLASWMNEQAALRERWDLGSHVVIRGAVARGVLTALMWMTPSLSKVYLHPDEATAFAAARVSLAQANARRS